MKVRKIKYSLFASMMAVVAVFLASCEDTLEIGKLPDESQYEDIYAKNGYLRDAKSNRVTNIIDLFTENYKTSVRLGLTKAPTRVFFRQGRSGCRLPGSLQQGTRDNVQAFS